MSRECNALRGSARFVSRTLDLGVIKIRPRLLRKQHNTPNQTPIGSIPAGFLMPCAHVGFRFKCRSGFCFLFALPQIDCHLGFHFLAVNKSRFDHASGFGPLDATKEAVWVDDGGFLYMTCDMYRKHVSGTDCFDVLRRLVTRLLVITLPVLTVLFCRLRSTILVVTFR